MEASVTHVRGISFINVPKHGLERNGGVLLIYFNGTKLLLLFLGLSLL